jgi:type I restriction enzyme S subunit
MVEVKPGYKQTEVGVIPVNWELAKLRTLGELSRGKSKHRPRDAKHLYGGQYPFIQTGDVRASQGRINQYQQTYSEAGLAQSRLWPAGTMCITIAASVAETGILNFSACFPDSIIGFIADDKKCDAFYIEYILRYMKNVIQNQATASTQDNINLGTFERLELPLPSLHEQRAITEALSDVDAQIAALDALIAKKRDIKQGAMQQLLTGQQRLPGFVGEWETFSIAKSSTLKARIGWQGLTTAEYLETGDYCLITGTDFIDGRIHWDTCHFVEKVRFDQDRNIQLRIGDVLVTKDGTIGKVAYIDRLPSDATLNSGVFVIRPKNGEYHSLFLYYILTSTVFDKFLLQLQAGSTINHLYQKDFVDFNFSTPSIEEQTAIATILSDMDADIAALEQQRDKTRDLKQGMMQELLTGKTRLI